MLRSLPFALCALVSLFQATNGRSEEIRPDATLEKLLAGSIWHPENAAAIVFDATGTQADGTRALEMGWEAVKGAYDSAGTPISAVVALSAESGVSQFGKINNALTEIGLLMAVHQLYSDLSSGNYETAGLSFQKNVSLYAASKYGWKALRVASVGVSILDYSLNRLATTVLGSRYEAWESAYRRYYNDETRLGRRSVEDWRKLLDRMTNENPRLGGDDVKRAMYRYLDEFWDDVNMNFYFDKKLRGEPPPKEKAAIRDRYFKEQLIPYLKPLFDRYYMQARTRLSVRAEQALEEVLGELNKPRLLQVQVRGPKDKVGDLQVEIGSWHGRTDENGHYDFPYTLYGYLCKSSPWDEVRVHYPHLDNGRVLRKEVTNLEIARSQSLTFDVTGSWTASVVDKSTGRPIPGATVSVEGGGFSTRASTDDGGKAFIPNIPLGTYDLRVEAEGYRAAVRSNALFEPGDDPSQPTKKTATISLDPLETEPAVARLGAAVYDKTTNQWLSGARVRIEGEAHATSGTTDSEGRVIFEELPYGTYTLTATASGYEPSSPVRVRLDQEFRSGKIGLAPNHEPAELEFEEDWGDEGSVDDEPIPPSPEPPAPGPCEYREIASFEGASGEDVIEGDIPDKDQIFSGKQHTTKVPGPGTLRVSVKTTGRHELANHEYGAMRFASRIVLSSPQGAVTNGSWVGGGSFYPGVRDYGTNSYSWEVRNAGDIAFDFVPERCDIMNDKGKIRCWIYGERETPGIKLLPTTYSFTVEFKPCH